MRERSPPRTDDSRTALVNDPSTRSGARSHGVIEDAGWSSRNVPFPSLKSDSTSVDGKLGAAIPRLQSRFLDHAFLRDDPALWIDASGLVNHRRPPLPVLVSVDLERGTRIDAHDDHLEGVKAALEGPQGQRASDREGRR
ncbi:MAG: hypothetical protein ABEI52_06810 [Halobacteriaceae archaeon]